MTTKTKTPSPSMSEQMVDRHYARDPATGEIVQDVVLSQMRDAMRGARLAAEKAQRVADAVLSNEMETLPARHRRVGQEAWRQVEPALRALDAAIARARQDIEASEARTKAPPRPADAVGAMLASEIRARMAALPTADRRKAIEAAFRDSDDTVLSAVLSAPPMLSGVESAAEMGMLLSRWRRERHGPEVDRATRLSRAAEDLTRAGQLAVSFVAGLSNPDIVERAEASVRAVEAALRS